jgi:putative transcription factor
MPSRPNQVGQDFKPQVFNTYERAQQAQQAKKPVTESSAARLVAQGAATVEKKQHLSLNKHDAGPGARAKALDEDNESTKVKTVSHQLSAEIQRQRQLKNMTQKDLATLINEKQSVVTDYEQGKAVPNEGVIQRMEKALGVYLRGVKAGQPMEQKKTKKQLQEEADKAKAEEEAKPEKPKLQSLV